VRWRPGADHPSLPRGTLGSYGVSPTTGVERLTVPTGEELAMAGSLSSDSGVLWAEPNYLRRPARTVNDPRFGEQWALPRIRVPEAWDVTMGVPFVIVAVVDSGVDLDHPDLQGQLVDGYNLLDPGSPPRDDSGHGTHAAGIIAAVANNGVGIAGVAPNVMIMPLKVLDSAGVGRDSDVAEAIHYAVDHGAWVVNMSFNGRDSSRTLEEAVAYASERGVVLVVAAGNEGRDAPSYPGAIKPAIAVGATALDDRRAFFSNFGPWVDLAAPGQAILSTFWNPTAGSVYTIETGTSTAAPLVAGVVALMFSAQPFLSVDDIVAALSATADPLDSSGVGAGQVNAEKAVLAVLPPESPTPTVTPTALPSLTESPATPTATPTGIPTLTPGIATPVPTGLLVTVTPGVGGTPALTPPPAAATASPTPSQRATPTAGFIRVTPSLR
jgi:subtilisin family serine protease